MAVATFKTLASSIINNAASYETKEACSLAIGRVKAAWAASGSLGVWKHLRDDAIFECQLRFVELSGMEREASVLAS